MVVNMSGRGASSVTANRAGRNTTSDAISSRPTVEFIREIAGQFEDDYSYIGIRTQSEPFELGEINHLSHIWDEGEDTNEELDGISVTNINSPAVDAHANEYQDLRYKNGYYWGEYSAIIGGDYAVEGQDYGELIIQDPVVLYVFDRHKRSPDIQR